MTAENYSEPKKYDGVMVSSTFKEMEHYRDALIKAIDGQKLHAVAMEKDTAKIDDIITSSLEMVADAAAYIGIIGHKYGQIPPCPRRNPNQLSITELEFNRAQELDRPILIFIKDNHPGEGADAEADPVKLEKLNAFRERAKQKNSETKLHRVYGHFKTLDDFGVSVANAVARLNKQLDEISKSTPQPSTNDSQGFICTFRPGQLPQSLAVHLHEDFVDRDKELKTLTELVTPNSIIPIEGVQQSGKTVLVAKFLSSDSVRRKLTPANQSLAEVSILYVDLEVAIGPRPVLRRLAYALGELKRIPDADEPAAGAFEEIRAQLLYEILLVRLKSRVPFFVLDDVDMVPEKDHNKDDLRALLEYRPCRYGAVLVLTCRPVSKKITTQTGREIKKTHVVGSLAENEAEELLVKLLGDAKLATETINLVKAEPDLLLPGAFVEAIAEYKSRLNVGSVEKSPSVLAEIILQCAAADVLKSLKAVGCDTTPQLGGPFGPHISILCMAVLAKLPVAEQHLSLSKLPVEYFVRLRDQGWFQNRKNGCCLTAIMSSALRVQIEALLKDPGGKKASIQLADAVDTIIQAVERESAQEDDTLLVEALEEAIGWLERRLPGEKSLGNRLWRAFLPHTTDDLIAPISTNDSIELLKRFGDSDEPVSVAMAIAKLVLEIRVGNDVRRYMEALRVAVSVVKKSPSITVQQLRGLDGAALSGAFRYQLSREVLELRESLVDKLCDFGNSVFAPSNLKRTAATWLLATADLGFRLGKPIEWGNRLLDQINHWLESPQIVGRGGVAESELAWLRARASRLAALLESNPENRIKHSRAAVAGAEYALAYGARKISQVQFYLRMVRSLLPELPQESQRKQAAIAATDVVARTFGKDQESWPLEIYTQLAALFRYNADLTNSPQTRLSQLHEAVEFLKPAKNRIIDLAQQGDARPLLVLARLYRTFARELSRQGKYTDAVDPTNEARRLGELAVKRSANATTWTFLVNLENRSTEPTTSFSWNYELIGETSSRVSDLTKDLIKRCRHWLDGVEHPGFIEGRVALQCLQCEWRAQGSLMHAAIQEAASQGGEWERISADSKRNLLGHHFQQRMGRLQHTEKRYGNFLELALARIRLEAQFQYFVALLHKDGVVETSKVLSLLLQAAEHFPNSLALEIERARFYRRIWNYGDAIAAFTKVAERTLDAVERREIAIELIETLTTASIHTSEVQLPNGIQMAKQSLISQAHDWLDRLFNFPDVAKEVAILRDLVELELGMEINWAKNDEAYNSVIGGSESYCSTVVDHLDSLRSEGGDSTAHLWEAVIQNFTHAEVLRGLGRLYLRSAEKNGRGQPLQDAERAYGCFNACRILEMSECGRESSVTSHERARAILAGAKISRSLNPFKADHKTGQTLLDVAEARFSSARDRSVGSFHQSAIERIKELCELRTSLKNNP